ncbi:hypothetical protein [Bacillus sp. AK128]
MPIRSGFFFSIVFFVLALLFELENPGFSITNIFLGLIAGALIDLNIKIFYKNKVGKVSRLIEGRPKVISIKKEL